MITLFVISNTRLGGAENFTLRLIERLKKEFPGDRFDCLVTHTNGDLHGRYKAAFHNFSTGFQARTFEEKVKLLQISCGGYDLIHSVDNFDLFAAAAAGGWRCTAPIIQQVFLDVSVSEHKYVLDLITQAAPNYSAIATEMPQNITVLPIPCREPRKKCTIANGVDTDIWNPGDAPKQKKVCWVGRLTARKGGLILAEIIKRMPDVDFSVIANEPNTEQGFLHNDFLELERKCPNLDYRWTLSPEELREVYRSSQVYLHTSLSEAQPGTLLEAMSCGCFPVAGAVGGVPSIVAESGFLVDTKQGDTVEKFSEMLFSALNDVGHLRGVRERIVNHYSLVATVQKYAALYREVLEA